MLIVIYALEHLNAAEILLGRRIIAKITACDDIKAELKKRYAILNKPGGEALRASANAGKTRRFDARREIPKSLKQHPLWRATLWTTEEYEVGANAKLPV